MSLECLNKININLNLNKININLSLNKIDINLSVNKINMNLNKININLKLNIINKININLRWYFYQNTDFLLKFEKKIIICSSYVEFFLLSPDVKLLASIKTYLKESFLPV